MNWKNLVNRFFVSIRNYLSIVLFVIIISFIWFTPYHTKQTTELNNNIWQESFDLTQIPSGYIIWSHGVPGTEAEFNFAQESYRFYYFDLGIMTKDKIIHRIRIPFYVMGAITSGGNPIDFRGDLKKDNNNSNLYKKSTYIPIN